MKLLVRYLAMQKISLLLAVTLFAVSCGISEVLTNESSPEIGVSGLAFHNLDNEDLVSLSEWCEGSSICSEMTHDDAVLAFEAAAHIMCEASESYDIPVKPGYELEELLQRLSSLPMFSVSDGEFAVFVTGVTMTACPEMVGLLQAILPTIIQY